MSDRPVVIGVSPHPDDELLGAPATLMGLRDAGWRVINFACALGRPEDHGRRRAELTRACELAGFELVIADPPVPIGANDDLGLAQRALAEAITTQGQRYRARLLVGPSPHDGHHGHEVTGRAICDAVQSRGQPCEVMFWGLWGELPIPNLLTPFGPARMAEIQLALAAHAGELARNRFDRLLTARARANAVVGPERVFGFGGPGRQYEFAELLTQVSWSVGAGWRLVPAREFDPSHAGGASDGIEIGWWLRAASVADVVRRKRSGGGPDAKPSAIVEDRDCEHRNR
ncbi:MAG: PIG-L deacetylase family protein [Solirubrobacteraceae bacterium]